MIEYIKNVREMVQKPPLTENVANGAVRRESRDGS